MAERLWNKIQTAEDVRANRIDTMLEELRSSDHISDFIAKYFASESEANRFAEFLSQSNAKVTKRIEKRMKETNEMMAKMSKEEFVEFLHGDGIQTKLVGQEAKDLHEEWGDRGDYKPGNEMAPLSDWTRVCFNADMRKMLLHLEKNGKKILELRESFMRFSALFHVISGATALSPRQSRNHRKVFHFLIDLGARIDAKDVAGYTPLHHCLNPCNGNDLTLKMARVLLQKGVDPNAVNRFGNPPILECFFYKRQDQIDLLLEFGADLGQRNFSGISTFDIAATLHHDLMPMFSENMKEKGRELLKKMRDEGTIESCAQCGTKESQQKCGGCHIVYYCSKSCQAANWDEHKMKCKKTKNCFEPVKLDSSQYLSMHSHSEKKIFSSGNKPVTKKIFMIKVQRSGGMENIFMQPKSPDETVVLYNQDRSFQSFVSKQCPNFKRLEKMVFEKGIWGVKAYCHAKWSEENDLLIDMENVMPYQDW